jgi:hypothetical protein
MKTFQFWIQKSVSDDDFLFTFIVYHMADKDESDLVMVSNESETVMVSNESETDLSPLYACSLTSIGHDDRFLFNNPRVQ